MSDSTSHTLAPQRRSPGFGLGLRTAHYNDFLSGPQPVDWLEIISDNFLVEGGKPLRMLDTFRRDYPMAMHGVAMSIGSAQGLNLDYLKKIKALVRRVEPMWVSDHLCWTGPSGRSLYDLYPLPYTEECARLLVDQIRQAQDVLERRLVVENVSSYLRFSASGQTEWDFLAHVAQEADCELLVDVNNIYVSSVNHGFDPLVYLRAMPRDRVRQIHLAGHANNGDHIIDTHDHPVAPEVWALYAQTCLLFGPTATMIERDDNIPPLVELLEELQQARSIAAQHGALPIELHPHAAATPWATAFVNPAPGRSINAPALDAIQNVMANAVLGPQLPEAVPAALDTPGPLPAPRGLAIYHNAYRARLAEVLADIFPKTVLYVGSDHFDELARAYVEQQAPDGGPLNGYGHRFAEHLGRVYPDHPVLRELAELEWALRSVFDAADEATWQLADIQAQGVEACLTQWPVLHPTVRFLEMRTTALAIWKAIDADEEVAPAQALEQPLPLIVWRQGLQPHFSSLDADEAGFIQALQQPGHSIERVTEQRLETQQLKDPQLLAAWLQQWWSNGFLHRSMPMTMTMIPTTAVDVPDPSRPIELAHAG